MSRSRFDSLRERLLKAGIAPRHVRRYLGELHDHSDDLVREEIAGGATRQAAEANADARLGNDDDLAQAMLARPELRSVAARFPWAVFAVGPVIVIPACLIGAILLEIGIFDLISTFYHNPAHLPPPAWFTSAVLAYNTIVTWIMPPMLGALLVFIGTRQRVSTSWIVTGAVIACFLGAFQELSWYDTGYKGELELSSGLGPPFPRDLIVGGIARTCADLLLISCVWWAMVRRRVFKPA